MIGDVSKHFAYMYRALGVMHMQATLMIIAINTIITMAMTSDLN